MKLSKFKFVDNWLNKLTNTYRVKNLPVVSYKETLEDICKRDLALINGGLIAPKIYTQPKEG